MNGHPQPRIANARMYSMTPAARAAWRELLAAVLGNAGLDWSVIDHGPPEGIDRLWAREDLGLVQMCGLPFAQALEADPRRYRPVASPVIAGGDGSASYRTHLLVRADYAARTLEDSFGGVAGFTVRHSQSGYAALLAALRPYVAQLGRPVYRHAVGGFNGYRAGLEALARGKVDVMPVDSYVHDLLALHEPELMAGFRTLHSTPFTPAPLFVTHGAVDDSTVARLRVGFAAWVRNPASRPVRAALLLEDFAFPEAGRYAELATRLKELEALPRPWASEEMVA